jgi:nicotinamide-nucleotide amidase
VPGASDVLAGGVVSYANDVKVTELGVPEELIAARGAVSAEVAEAMAVGVRERLGVEVGISVTGVAGPGGGTPEKPVGLVHFYVSTPDGGEARSFSLPGDRATIRSRATVSALHLARRVLARSRHEVA